MGRQPTRGRGPEPRLPDDLPAAGAQDRPARASIPTTSARRFRARVDDDNGVVTILRGKKRVDEPLPRGLTPGQPIENCVKREALLRFVRVVRRRRSQPLPGARRRCSSAARRTCGSTLDPVGGGALARRELPVRAGPARLGQDLAGRADGDRADARRQARRRHLAQPQGDPQPAARDPARGRRAGLHASAGVKRARDEDESETRVREPLHRLVGRHGRLRRPVLRPRRRHRLGAARARPSTCTRPSGRSTCSSSTRPASSRSPTCSPPARRARSLVLLGDPNQLPQVSQGSHPRTRGSPCCSTCSAST